MNKFLFLLSVVLFVFACERGENETKISSYGGTKSHNNGQNCMSCHKSGGKGEGWFTAAGSIYKKDFASPSPNCTILLYTAPGGAGSLKTVIESDALGNFYTTEKIDFSQGLYPAVKNSSDSIRYMGTYTTTGQCNSCHGVSNDKIWVY